MRSLLTIAIACYSLLGLSQWKTEVSPNHFSDKKAILLRPNNWIGTNPDHIKEYLLQTINNFQQDKINLELDTIIESLTGTHFTFHQTYDNIKIHDSQIKVNINKNGVITSIFDYSFDPNLIEKNDFTNSNFINSLNTIYHIIKPINLNYLFINNSLTPVGILTHLDEGEFPFELGINHRGEIIYSRDLSLYFDSTVSGTVFLPDPLSTAGVSYGIPYVDNEDNDIPFLNDERDTVSFTADYDNGVFNLESPSVKITDHSTPSITPVTSSINTFYHTRSENGFEDVNAYFHINQMQQHIQNLGFTNIVNYPIHIDTHGLNGQDNSVFQSSFTPPRITFGEGGVDDAEDADVILHEYGHAIMHSASPGTNIGDERRALDEAAGDYFAASFSKSITLNNWDQVYTWDGHNEFWSGRMATSTKHYPEDLQGNLYLDTDIWSATLMQIWDVIGRDATDQLMIESAYGYASGMSMMDAALLFYQADIDLNNGANSWTICNYFQNRGLMNSCPNSVIDSESTNTTIKLINSEGFTRGTENASFIISTPTSGTLSIHSIKGQLINEISFEGNQVEVSPSLLRSGVYIINIATTQGSQSFKLIRL